jgi:selenoprotein W-related protein
MAEHILEAFEQQIASLALVTSGGGVFEVTVDGDLIYSKKATGRHADPEEVLAALRERVA